MRLRSLTFPQLPSSPDVGEDGEELHSRPSDLRIWSDCATLMTQHDVRA